MSGVTENMVHAIVQSYLGGGAGKLGGNHYHERHAIVTSYDSDKYLAKVTYMPEGQESGWLPVEAGHIGADYGIAVGLQPGNGKDTGDQVIVRFQEGDLESGKIVQRVHSDADKPPKVESGEMVMWTKFRKSKGKSEIGDETTDQASGDDDDQADSGQGGSGQQIYFKKDGSITWTDGNGATTVHDGKGNITITSTNNTITTTAKGDITVHSTGGNIAVNSDSGNVTVNAASTVEVTAPTINAVGTVHLGSEGGVQTSQKGTVDSGGFVDIAGLAAKVYTT